MNLIIQKYGGSSVANTERIRNVAKTITEAYKNDNNVVVVVSAQGDTTDDLIAKANEINPKSSKREMDMLLSCGELMSASMLAMAIEALSCPVISLAGWQVGMQTDSHHGVARFVNINKERLQRELDKRKIVIVAGFQGINKNDDVTTLGRGGSDTSAVALAAVLDADLCQIYTDVDGIYTTDPRIVSDASKLDEISYEEMLELASLGANVLNSRSVELAQKYNVKLQVLSSMNKSCGTYVKEVDEVEKTLVRGVARDNNIARISLLDIDDIPGKAYEVFSILSEKNINVDLIIQSVGRNGKQDMSFTVTSGVLQETLDVLAANSPMINARDVVWDEDVSKVSIVGSGIAANPGVAAAMFNALYKANINIQMISTSEIKVSVLIAQADAERAVCALHKHFDL